MDPVKLTSPTASSSPVEREDRARDEAAAHDDASVKRSEEAVRFDPEETQFGQVFKPTQKDVDEAIAREVEKLRERVAEKGYEPDVKTLAERILAELEALKS